MIHGFTILITGRAMAGLITKQIHQKPEFFNFQFVMDGEISLWNEKLTGPIFDSLCCNFTPPFYSAGQPCPAVARMVDAVPGVYRLLDQPGWVQYTGTVYQLNHHKPFLKGQSRQNPSRLCKIRSFWSSHTVWNVSTKWMFNCSCLLSL